MASKRNDLNKNSGTGTEQKKRVKIKKQPLVIAAAAAVLVIAVGVGLAFFAPWGEEAEEPDEKEDTVQVEKEKEAEIERDPVDPILRCAFCGRPGIEEGEVLSRPVAVTLGNSPDERPHSGVSQACTVYEYPVEGGFTRLMGIFSHDYDGPIGPVRSARFYFVTLALEYDALYTHVGGYPPVMQMIREHNTANINEFQHGGAFWRSEERRAPHDAYTTLENITTMAENAGYRETGQRETFLPYWDPEKTAIDRAEAEDWEQVETSGVFPSTIEAAQAPAESITIHYGSVQVTYDYQGDQEAAALGAAGLESENDNQGAEDQDGDQAEEKDENQEEDRDAGKEAIEAPMPGAYKRLVNGEPHFDQATDTALKAEDIIIQYVSSRVIDDVGRLRLGMIGEGEGLYLAGGKKMPIRWEKASHREPTEFYLADSEESLEVMPGQTWVHVVPEHNEVTITPDDAPEDTSDNVPDEQPSE